MIEESAASSKPDTATVTSPAGSAGPPLEWLETQICELAGQLTAATYRFLALLGDFDARQGWAQWDLPSCAAWLSWKCQLTAGTAREHVRVARALPALPVLSAEFAAGRMSFAKIRALTRIATPATDAGLAELAGPMTASQLERFVRAHRQVTRADDQDAAVTRRLTWRQEPDGTLAMTVRLPPADGAVVLQALRAAAGDLVHPHADRDHKAQPASGQEPAGTGQEPAGTGQEPGGTGQEPAGPASATPGSLADALVDVAGAFLAGKAAAAANPDIYQVIVHVGSEALAGPPAAQEDDGVSAETAGSVPATPPGLPGSRPAGHPAHPRRCHIEDGPAISPATAQAIACSATITWMLHDHDGTLLDVGRRHRTPPPALRRAVRERDRYRCQFPGCESRKTDIHHIVHWAKHGETKLVNLILLCKAHHVIVHDGGYIITAKPGGFTFTTTKGTTIPASPQLPATDADISTCHDATITPDTIIPAWHGDRLDLDLAIWACFANARIDQERLAAQAT
jgi:hypothetical protein